MGDLIQKMQFLSSPSWLMGTHSIPCASEPVLGGLYPGVHLKGSTAKNTPWWRCRDMWTLGHVVIWVIYGWCMGDISVIYGWYMVDITCDNMWQLEFEPERCIWLGEHRWRLCGKQEWPWITSQANGKLSSEVGKELEYGVTTTRQIHTNAAKTNSHLGTLAFYPYNSTTHRNHRISCQQLQMVQDYICHLWHTHTHTCFSWIVSFHNFTVCSGLKHIESWI